jgi:PAS domain S-box-containing protein
MPEPQSRSIGKMADDAEIAQLAAILQSSNDAIVGMNLDGAVQIWNRRAELLYGYSREEMLGRSITILRPSDRTDIEADIFRRIRDGCRVAPFETIRQRKDGTLISLSVNISPVLNEGFQISGFSDVARELTPSLTSDRAIAQLAAIVDSSDDAIIGNSIDGGVIQSWNGGAERLYGYTAQEVLGQPMFSLLPKNLFDEEKGILERVRRGEHVDHFDTIRIHKEGRPIEVSLTISPIRDSTGEIIGVSHIARDVSETKRLKDKLQVSQKMEALGRLAGGVAHDFNNLLTVINGYGALLQTALKDEPDCQDMANEVMAAAGAAAELTRQLLIFSRNQVVRLQPIDLNSALLGTLAMLRRLLGEDITIETRLAPDLESVRADPGHIGQILMNLSANARDAMPGGGRITIQSESWIVEEDEYNQRLGFAPGRYVRLLFSDTGHGMDAKTQAHIFEPFFTTKEIGKGTGLGLATVYGIVKQSGGQISVYSEPGSGTTFAIYFPSSAPESQAIAPLVGEVRRGSETILLVEDEPRIRKLALSILRANGYTVLPAGNAEEALSQSLDYSGAIQLMLTDVVMPGNNGQQLATRISEQRPKIRVMFMSGYTEHAILERILLEPKAAFLQKPFTPDQLLKKVREALDESPNFAPL